MKLILSLVIFILSIVIGFVYVRPEYYAVAQNKAKLVELTTALKNKESIKEITGQINEALGSIDSADKNSLDVFLPETLDQIRFANNLQHIGKQSGLDLLDIKVEEKKKPSTSVSAPSAPSGNAIEQSVQGAQKTFSLDQTVSEERQDVSLVVAPASKSYVTTKASFSVIASYTEFLIFLSDLEKSLGLINITSLKFKEYQESKNPEFPSYQFFFEIETYSLK
ncbi:MAG: hypothetical protein PHS95_01955 [Candidatus Pacebacteria bacterium]|nr:hypothetical protein [Candidatus Paceibacterota bacterium]